MANTRQRKKATPKKKTALFAISWLLVAVLLVALFFSKKDTIENNLKTTDFFGKLSGKATTESQNVYTEATGSESIRAQKENIPIASAQESAKQEDTQKKETQKDLIDNKGEKDKPSEKNKDKPSDKKSPDVAMTTTTLYFVVIDNDGSVSRKAIKKEIKKSTSPLTATIKALLDGPDKSDRSGSVTLIPQGTKLLGASVKNGVATLNFSDEIEFNSVGVDGYMASLMQIVYTATEFPTVRSVQFLIEGNVREYLGSDGLLPGLYIKTPLDRKSF